ncbi:MAG: hypothetical protein E7207_00965 [Clostridium butyricum]|nr:hypothetical protein [Clostridium butyricum]
MMKTNACTLILKDDFDNILVLKKRVKRGEIGKWSLLSQKLRGKESFEKCINKACSKILKTIVFDLEEFKEYEISEEESLKVFTGDLKGRFVLDKSYDEAKWINIKEIDEYEFEDMDKTILLDFAAR